MSIVQEKQGYILYLDLDEDDEYEDACLKVKALVENQYGSKKELLIISDKLNSFDISLTGELIYNGKLVSELTNEIVGKYKEEQMENRAKEERNRQNREKELEEQRIKAKQLFDKSNAEKLKYLEELKGYDFGQSEYPIFDSRGNRLLRCTYCGRVDSKHNFCYWDKKNINTGACKNCKEKRKKEVERIRAKYNVPKMIEKGNCPMCNGEIVERHTPLGRYRMCVDYPDCGFREKVD